MNFRTQESHNVDKNKQQILKKTLLRLNAQMRVMGLPLFQIYDVDIEGGESTVVLMNAVSEFNIYIQLWAPQQNFSVLLKRLKAVPGNALLLADFINPVMSEKLKQRVINFVDCAGNLSLQTSGMNVFIKHNKDVRRQEKGKKGCVFNPVGLKLLYAFFNSPELLNVSYRTISNKVNVALGGIGPVLEDLQLSGYVAEKENRKWLVNKQRLFERWVDAYLEKLRPKQMLGRYHAVKADWWKKVEIKKYNAQWGGEIVIAKQTPFIQPENITVYFLGDSIDIFLQDNQLQQDTDGEVVLYQAFWMNSTEQEKVSPMIVYADLVDSIDPGNRDVAKVFYGEAITGLLAE